MSLVLFQPSSPANDSVVFELKQQMTVVAMGMQPDDYITFEIVLISDAARAKICGCRLLESGMSSVYQLQPLMCPACSDGSPRYVRVTPQNPIVVLDAPQGALLRAMYHGTGVDLHTVTVTVGESDTIDLTSTLRGCPPVYCEDEPETWTPTGLHRCTTTNVEIEEISNCGNKRWVECGPTVWTDTGNRRCLAGSYSMQETNQCGALRWSIIEAEVWVDTGATSCYDNAGVLSVRAEQTNQCGARRWNDAGPATWVPTGNFRCAGNFIEIEERSQPCGTVRWNNQNFTQPVTWEATGSTRCTASAYEREERNNCGDLRWTFISTLVWLPTGTYDCRNNINWRQEANQCGDIRWVNTGESCGVTGHTMTSLTPAAGNVIEGAVACWNFSLNAPVVGEPLVIEFDVSGADHARHGYTSPRTVSIPPGASSGQVCITTINDAVVDGNETLCLTPRLSARLTNAPGTSCILVLDNDETPYSIIDIEQTTPDPIIEGQQVCWQVTLSRPVETNPLSITVAWSGADDVRNNYPNTTFTIPVGSAVGNLCLYTTDDLAVDGTEQLCIGSILSNPRLTGSPVLPCVDVLDNDTLPPGDSSHAILSIVPVTTPITEGQQACWLVTLDAPVANSNLIINFSLSGADQTRHGYPPPSLMIPVGSSSGTVCVTSTDDVVVDGMEQLCITAITSGRITAVPAASCINVNDNDVAASVHTITCVTPPAAAVEGTLVCWTFELDAPVAVSPLTVTGTLSGSEQVARGYANPSVVIPVGQSTGQLCVQTIDDNTVEGTKQLCLTIATSARVTAVNDVSCAGAGGQASLVFTNVFGVEQNMIEGETLNVRIALSAPAPAGGVSGNLVFSGTEKTAHPAQYPDIAWTVPEAFSSQDYSVAVFDDALIDGTTNLIGTITVVTPDWTLGVPSASASVLDNDAGDGGGGGGGCYMSGTELRTPTGYRSINGIRPGDEVLAFALPGMLSEFEPDWALWQTGSLQGLSYLAATVLNIQPFQSEGAIRINGGPPTTPEHNYFAFDGETYGWRQAKALNARYSLVTMNGLVPVVDIETMEGTYTFFKIDVEAPDTIIAKTPFGAVLAHNIKRRPEDTDPMP